MLNSNDVVAENKEKYKIPEEYKENKNLFFNEDAVTKFLTETKTQEDLRQEIKSLVGGGGEISSPTSVYVTKEKSLSKMLTVKYHVLMVYYHDIQIHKKKITKTDVTGCGRCPREYDIFQHKVLDGCIDRGPHWGMVIKLWVKKVLWMHMTLKGKQILLITSRHM